MTTKRSLWLAAALSATSALGLVRLAVADDSASGRLGVIEADQYTIAVDSVPAAAGSLGELRLVLTAKEGFKVNALYPTRLSLAAPHDAVELPRPELRRDDATIDAGARSLAFTVPVRVLRSGAFVVEGKLKLSVCSDSSCVIDARRLSVAVSAR